MTRLLRRNPVRDSALYKLTVVNAKETFSYDTRSFWELMHVLRQTWAECSVNKWQIYTIIDGACGSLCPVIHVCISVARCLGVVAHCACVTAAQRFAQWICNSFVSQFTRLTSNDLLAAGCAIQWNDNSRPPTVVLCYRTLYCSIQPDRQWRSSSFQEYKKVRVSRDLWPWPWPWAHPGCRFTWRPSCASLVAIRPFVCQKKRFAQKFTDGWTDDGRRAIA